MDDVKSKHTRTVDALGNQCVADKEYYLQDARSVVGNCILWWGKESKGYTCDLKDAGRYKGALAFGHCDTDIPWPCNVVDDNTVVHVRAEPLNRIVAAAHSLREIYEEATAKKNKVTS